MTTIVKVDDAFVFLYGFRTAPRRTSAVPIEPSRWHSSAQGSPSSSCRAIPAADPARQAQRSLAWAVEPVGERELETAAIRHATGRSLAAADVRAALAALVPGTRARLTTEDALRLEASNLYLMRQARAERLTSPC